MRLLFNEDKTTNLELRRQIILEQPEFDRTFGLLHHGQDHNSHESLIQMTRCQREDVDFLGFFSGQSELFHVFPRICFFLLRLTDAVPNSLLVFIRQQASLLHSFILHDADTDCSARERV